LHIAFDSGRQAVGAWLASDLLRSSIRPYRRGVSGIAKVSDFAAGARQIASKLAPTPFGQKRE
jgi:hypothetical protein